MPFSLKAFSVIFIFCGCSMLILLGPYSTRDPPQHSYGLAPINLQHKSEYELRQEQLHQTPQRPDRLPAKTQSPQQQTDGLSRNNTADLEDELCYGKRVFIHDLPGSFNSDLLHLCRYGLTGWLNFCPHIANDGFGEPLQAQVQVSAVNGSFFRDSIMEGNVSILEDSSKSVAVSSSSPFLGSGWYRTDPYMLEVVFHRRLLRYACLTKDPEMADAFFLPYYTGIDALRFLYGSGASKPKERHGSELVKWLKQDAIAKKAWQKFDGRDHFLVMGRTAWDFDGSADGGWGTGILHIPEYESMTILLIEREPWSVNQHAIPYPTSFHPSSASELDGWIRKVRSVARPTLFTFVGSLRPELMKNGIREALIDQCSSSKNCQLLDCKRLRCSHNPQPIIETFLHSQFCLQPRGDTATRRSLFDSIISGCIPVLFHNDTAYSQYKWHLPAEAHQWSVYMYEEKIRGGARLEDALLQYTQETIDAMRNALIDMIPRTVYAGFSSEEEIHEDAVDVTVGEVLKIVSKKKRKWPTPPGSNSTDIH